MTAQIIQFPTKKAELTCRSGLQTLCELPDKVINIAAVDDTLFALCEDGSLFQIWHDGSYEEVIIGPEDI